MKRYAQFYLVLLVILGFAFYTKIITTTVKAIGPDYPKAVKVYFIKSSDNTWYTKGPAGFVKWGPRDKASVWTIKEQAERAKNESLGQRAQNSKIVPFLTIPRV